jgi:hypothetical protein
VPGLVHIHAQSVERQQFAAGAQGLTFNSMPAPSRTRLVFFYGLFMDAEILGAQGVAALSAEPCLLSGFGLRIGDRATLVSSAGDSVYGMLMSVSETDLNKLYSAPGLEEYVPESVVVVDSGGVMREALCYNLRKPPARDHANPEYAEQLSTLARRLGFPEHYVRSIR